MPSNQDNVGAFSRLVFVLGLNMLFWGSVNNATYLYVLGGLVIIGGFISLLLGW